MPEYYENIYPYKPSLPLALSAATLFVILALLHTYQALRSKSWYLAAFVTGGYCMSTPSACDHIPTDDAQWNAWATLLEPFLFNNAQSTRWPRSQPP